MLEQFPDGVDLLLPIQPEHASRIYSGQKIFELRKILPKDVPRRIFLYETRKGGITGHVIIEKTISATPAALWDLTGRKGTTKERFFQYFSDRQIAHAFKVLRAVKYRNPVPLNHDLKGALPPPQNFFYLNGFVALHKTLRETAILESIKAFGHPFTLAPISESNERAFINLVNKHISDFYSETGVKYARKLLQVHKAGEDTEGIFSLKKLILEISQKKKTVGFCVLTEKVGGSVKTGPVVFRPTFRRRGLGKKLRHQLHEMLRAAGYRKVYCTVPVPNTAAASYLLGSHYKIEAHLSKQYHKGHDEFVFGFSLVDDSVPAKDYLRPNIAASSFSKISKLSIDALAFLQNEFCEEYCRLPNDWAARQIEHAIAKSAVPKFKPREIFTACTEKEIVSAAIWIPKRGGANKILLATRTSHVDSLARLIREVEKEAIDTSVRPRKLYSLVPTLDVTLQKALYQCGFRPEGVLDRPYRNSDHLVVLSKML